MTHPNARIIETGMRFERLVVQRQLTERKGREIQYSCLCDCGTECNVIGSHLRGGIKTSCGCLHRERLSEVRRKSIDGMKFGRLTVLATSKYVFNSKTTCDCICDCGTKVTVLKPSLTSGNTKSCGCLMREVVGNQFRTHGISKTRAYRTEREMARQARKLKATPKWADQGAIDKIYWHADCLREAGWDYQVDHIIPLRGKYVCGLHVDYNLQILTARRNQSKGSKFSVI